MNKYMYLFFTIHVSVASKIIMPDVVTAKAGTKLKVEALVSGKPVPVTTWKRGSDDVVTSDRLFVQKTLSSSTLMIKDVSRKDSGYYSLAAENSISKVNQILRIIIMGRLPLNKNNVFSRICIMNDYFKMKFVMP